MTLTITFLSACPAHFAVSRLSHLAVVAVATPFQPSLGWLRHSLISSPLLRSDFWQYFSPVSPIPILNFVQGYLCLPCPEPLPSPVVPPASRNPPVPQSSTSILWPCLSVPSCVPADLILRFPSFLLTTPVVPQGLEVLYSRVCSTYLITSRPHTHSLLLRSSPLSCALRTPNALDVCQQSMQPLHEPPDYYPRH